MTSPLVSICMPNLNGMPFIRQRMETFFSQTIQDWELIVCDGFSDDGSWEYLRSLSGDPRLRLYQRPRQGVTAAINFCLENATGNYIYIAPTDDIASPYFLELMTKPLERHRDIHIAVCDYEEIDERGDVIDQPPRAALTLFREWAEKPCIRSGKTEFLVHAALGTTVWCAIISVLFRRQILSATGLLPAKFGARSDEAWTLRACLASDVAWVPGRHAAFRRHATQLTQPHITAADFRVLLDSLAEDVRADNPSIPASWKQVRGWDRLICASRRYCYWQARGLGVGTAVRHPRRFLGAVGSILREDPRYLVEVARNKLFPTFAWSDRHSIAMNLIRVFQADWPPRVIEGGW